MRFLLYNIAYGTGYTKGFYHNVFTAHRYLKSSRHHFDALCSFIQDCEPDIVGLVEVDSGSVRAGKCDQVAEIARILTHSHYYSSKYGSNSFTKFVPILRHQGNALLTRGAAEHCQHHFFPIGFKRLVVEACIDGVRILIVHLALRRRVRLKQLALLADLIRKQETPVIVAGDFNTMSGESELDELLKVTGLRSANRKNAATYPSYSPRKELDFVLCSKSIKIDNFEIPANIRLSDHLPLILDYSVRG